METLGSVRRWWRLTRKIIQANQNKLTRPFKLTYVVTKECHSRCVHCHIWKERPNNELSLNEITEFTKKAPYLSWIDFTGGEPTDRPDIVEVVKAFIDNCPDLMVMHFPTNGLKPERTFNICKKILSLGSRRLVVSVSIDGPRDVNDSLRGIEGDFKLALDTYKRLKTLKNLDVYVGMTLFPKNMGLIDALVSEIQKEIPDFSYRDLHINLPHTSSHYYQNQSINRIKLDKQLLLKHIEAFTKKRGVPISPFSWIEKLYQRQVAKYLATGICPQDCGALMTQVYLAADGSLYPCSMWDASLGNIRDWNYSMVPGLESMEAKKLRTELLKKKCPNCWTPCEAYSTLASNFLRFKDRIPKVADLEPLVGRDKEVA